MKQTDGCSSTPASGEGAPLLPKATQEAQMNATDLCDTPATELGRLIRAKQLSPVELTDAVRARIEQLNL